MMRHGYVKAKQFTLNLFSWLVIVTAVFATFGFILIAPAKAATSGQTVLYLHKESSDANETYNSLDMPKSEPQAYTASGTTSTTNTNATPATSFCQSSNNTSNTFNQVSASSASTGNRCIATFISMPVGQAFSMATSDTSAISGQFWSSESASQVTAALNAYVYRWTGSGTSVVSTDRIATFTCADPGTSATSCAATAVAPANNITFAATDRIVVILSINVTGLRSGSSVSAYFDNSAQTTQSNITLKYTFGTPNKPTLSGSMDDDFTTALAPLTCSSSGVAMTGDTKWTCLNGTATNSTGDVSDGALTGTIGGDDSGFLKVHNTFTAAGTSSDFGTTPSNTFLYQSLPSEYGNGNIRTVEHSSLNFAIGATNSVSPWNHAGLVLWTSNTDYLEIQVYANASITGASANTACVSLNNSGSLGSCTGINSSVSNGLFNRIWLGFSVTNGSYQAQYSTDGTTWNSLDTAVAHTAFSRVGLNAFTQLGSASGDYAGAFDWFQFTPTFSGGSTNFAQDGYEFFNSAASTTPGTSLASANTAATLPSTGSAFRLRLLIIVTGNMTTSANNFKLQYIGKGSGTCAAPSGGTPSSWTDMSSSNTDIAYNTAEGPSNNASISYQSGTDPTDSAFEVAENYQNANNFTNTQNALGGNDSTTPQAAGEWDFALKDAGAPASTSYCFRAYDVTASAALSYTNYPEAATAAPGPTLDQILRGGEWFSGGVKKPFFWAS